MTATPALRPDPAAALRAIPPGEIARLSALPTDAQRQTLARIGACLQLDRARRGQGTQLRAHLARQLGISPSAMRALYYDGWRREGWTACIDQRRRGAGAHSPVPEACVQYILALAEDHQREHAGREVARTLQAQWQAWCRTGDDQHQIPGYNSPPAASLNGQPKGLSLRNIQRIIATRSSAYERSAIRQGPKAASHHLPGILGTRIGTEFLERVYFDDQHYDTKVVLPGAADRPMRPVGFNALDYLTGSFIDYCVRLQYRDIEADQWRTQGTTEFTWFTLRLLLTVGYRTAGTVHVYEHGTATGYNSQELHTVGGHHSFDAALAAVTRDAVTIDRSGRYSSAQFADLLMRTPGSSGQDKSGGGNFKYKAPIESLFNLVRNYMAALPGPTGRRYDLGPESGDQLDKWHKKHLGPLIDQLPQHIIDLIRYDYYTFPEFLAVLRHVYQAIDSRRDHSIEGWAKCGFVRPQWRWSKDTPWMDRADLAALPDPVRQHASLAMDQPGNARALTMCPAEAAQIARAATRITRLPDAAVPLLIPIEWARPVRVGRDRTISIKDRLLDPEPMHWLAAVETASGRRENLSPGDNLLAYLNPHAPQRLHLAEPSGAYVGVCHLIQRANPTNHSAREAQMKERARLKADLDAPLHARHRGTAERRADIVRHNDALLTGPIADAKAQNKAQARADRAARRHDDDLAAAADAALATASADHHEEDIPDPFAP